MTPLKQWQLFSASFSELAILFWTESRIHKNGLTDFILWKYHIIFQIETSAQIGTLAISFSNLVPIYYINYLALLVLVSLYLQYLLKLPPPTIQWKFGFAQAKEVAQRINC